MQSPFCFIKGKINMKTHYMAWFDDKTNTYFLKRTDDDPTGFHYSRHEIDEEDYKLLKNLENQKMHPADDLIVTVTLYDVTARLMWRSYNNTQLAML